jgi:DNA-binding Xre family transcriptional regulator
MIYFLRHTKTGLIKIGVTYDLDARLHTLRAAYGDLELLGLLAGFEEEENELHIQFKDANVRSTLKGREWFEPTKELMSYIGKYTSMQKPLPIGTRRRSSKLPFTRAKPVRPVMSGRVRIMLPELIRQKEMQLRHSLTMAEVAAGAKVSERLIYRWLNSKEKIERFDGDTLDGFCAYFGVGVGELLVYEA